MRDDYVEEWMRAAGLPGPDHEDDPVTMVGDALSKSGQTFTRKEYEEFIDAFAARVRSEKPS